MEKNYIRTYSKILLATLLALMLVMMPKEEKQEVYTPAPAPVAASTPPKVEPPKQEIAAKEVVIESAPITQTVSSGDSIEGIVRQAARKHGINEDYFVRIAKCESGLTPGAVNKNYYENGHPSGLFQHISGYWPNRAAKYGYAGASVFDAVANANVTAAMFRDGLQYLWECK